jgi:antitoxin component YwqK of YwqJK toxin-antitoxin module
VIYGPPGMIAAELFYEAGRLQGEARYFSQGQLIRIARYQAGLREGLTEDFTSEGDVSQSAAYKNDLLDGALCNYWKNGNLMERTQYEKGQRVGDIERFDQKGRPADADGKTTLAGRIESIFRG